MPFGPTTPFLILWRSTLRIHPKRQLLEMYHFLTLFSFASSLVAVFEPVFFYQLHYPLWQIAGYYAVHYTIYALALPLGGKFMARFGFERSLALSTPVFVLYFLALAALPQSPIFFWVAALLLTTHKTLYWPAFNAEFSRYGDGKNRGKEMSWMSFVTTGVGVIAPMIGGIVIAHWDFSTLFVISALSVMVAGFPLLRTKEHVQRSVFAYAEPWKMIVSSTHRRLMVSMVGMVENLVDLVFWPIFLFIILANSEFVLNVLHMTGAEALGYITAITVLLMSIIGFFIGEIQDKFSSRKILQLHLPFLMLSYLFRPISGTLIGIFLTSTLSRLAYIGVHIPMFALLYARGKRFGPLRYGVAMELALVVSKAVSAWILVAVFYFFLPYTAFLISFLMAAGFSALYFFL